MAEKCDKVGISGEVAFNVIDAKSGAVLREFRESNIVVNGARSKTAKAIGGIDINNSKIAKIGFGESDTAPTVQDTALTNAYVKAVESAAAGEDGQSVVFDFRLETSEGNGKTIKEMGLLCGDETLFSRRVIDVPIVKTVNIAIEGNWKIKYNLAN